MGLLAAREGEAWGVFEALSWAMQLGVINLVIETDALDVSNGLNQSSADISLRLD